MPNRYSGGVKKIVWLRGQIAPILGYQYVEILYMRDRIVVNVPTRRVKNKGYHRNTRELNPSLRRTALIEIAKRQWGGIL
jgi:hypothetical protein